MNRKARATIEQFAMLRQGDTVTAAVSGGADSVALLDFLCSLIDMEITVRACHLNHCLRGTESDRDEQLVRTMCAQYGVPLDVRRVEIKPLAKARGLSIEQTAREERYAFFSELIAQTGGKLATAHTLSDTAETVLFNLARGTGITGMCGIPPVRGEIIRPLIGCTRAEIEDYCTGHGLLYVTDSTNLSDDYTRNHIRHNVVPQLYRVNMGALEAVGRMTDTLRQDADYLAQAARQAAEEIAMEDGLDATRLAALHPSLRRRIIAGMLEARGVDRSTERIAMIEELLHGGRRYVMQVGCSDYAAVRGGVLRLERRVQTRKPEIQPLVFRKNALDGATVQLECGKQLHFSVIACADCEIFDNNTDYTLKNVADYDKISVDIFLRTRQAGDRIEQVGRGCGKSLKKLMNELALADRDSLCVIADSGGVVFAEGIGIDERVKVDPGTKNVLTFSIGLPIKKTEDDRT